MQTYNNSYEITLRMEGHVQTEHNSAATVISLVSSHVCALSSDSTHQYFIPKNRGSLFCLTTAGYYYLSTCLSYYLRIYLYILKSTNVTIHTHEDRQWFIITTHFIRTWTLWRSRTHIFWKCITLRHFVARNISNQPVMPFSILGVLAAGSIRIWQFKAHNICANTELCSPPICLVGYIPGTCQTLADVYNLNFMYFLETFFRMGTWMHSGLLLAEVKKYHLCPR